MIFPYIYLCRIQTSVYMYIYPSNPRTPYLYENLNPPMLDLAPKSNHVLCTPISHFPVFVAINSAGDDIRPTPSPPVRRTRETKGNN